jgi:UDPglucose 6-dehydrogenase
VIFVVTPTPSGADGKFDNKYVLEAVKSIGEEIAQSRLIQQTVVIVSTVMPGSMDGPIKDMLDQTAKTTTELVYSPEFIALGTVIHDMQCPDILLIGAHSDRERDFIHQLHLSICKNSPHVPKVTPIEAEIAKISINTYITMKISYANMIGELANSVGADSEAILDAVGADSRIGRTYFRSGLPFAGPCFPRDTVAFRTWAWEQSVPPLLPRATEIVNNRRKEYLATLARDAEGPYLIVGLAYKPKTNVLDESIGMFLAQTLRDRGDVVSVYDPWALWKAKEILGDEVTYLQSLDNLSEYKTIIVTDGTDVTSQLDHYPNILDCWTA